MSSVLSEEHVMLKDMAAGFFKEKAPVSLHRQLRDEDNIERFSRELWNEMVDMGWASIHVPEAFGGLEFGYRGVGIVMEEAGRSLAASPLLATVAMGASALVLGGSQQQKETLLPAVVSGELLLTLAIDEGPHHHPERIALAATADGDDYVLNGSKQFVPDASVAGKFIVAARTAGDAGSLAGISLLLVDADTDGVQISPRDMVDNRNTGLVTFENARVPAANLLGEVDRGGDLLEQILDRGRVALAAEMLGSMQQAFEDILEYLKERKQFGQAIGGFQALQHRAAKMFSDIELCKSVVAEAFTAIDEGRGDIAEMASLAKAMVNDAYHNISCEGIQMHGGVGMTDEYNIGFYLKRARVAEQSLGSSHYHRARFARLNGF